MAEESGGESWWGAWGTELLSNVRAKSAETFSLVKHDLAEFVTTIQHDTTVTVAETANTVKEKLKVEEDETDGSTSAVIRQGVSHWFGSLSTALKENVSQMTAVVDEPSGLNPGPVFDRAQARMHEIQTDPATYCNDPDGHPAHFEEWSRGFDLEQHKADISELLVNKPEIRSLYTKLVPSAVANSLFWTRYFYKIHRFHQEEKHRAALVERANKMDEEEIGWDDEEESWDVDETSLNHSKLEHLSPSEPNKDGSNITTPSAPAVSQGIEDKSNTKTNENPTSKDFKRSKDTDKDFETSVVEAIDPEPNAKSALGVVKTEGEPSSNTNEVKVQKSSDSNSLSSIMKDQASLDDDAPRESSTPVPRVPDQATLTQHRRTTSNVSEGKDDLHRENDSNSSVDSSWSKLSDEDLKQNNGKKSNLDPADSSRPKSGPSPSQSELSSSSVVVVPAIDDDDLDWDDDDDDLGGDINKEDTKKDDNQPPDDDDDDDWENWE